MKKLAKILACVLCAGVLGTSVLAFTACGTKTSIEISGSTSVNEIMTKLAGEYEKTHNVRININAQGSGEGIADTIAGRNDFGMSSRALKDEETSQGIEGKQLCKDGIALVVSKNCAVNQVTNEEVYNLYINGTQIVQGENTITSAVGRDSKSGTREAFDEKIKGGADNKSIKETKTPYIKSVSQFGSTGLVIDTIKADTHNRTIGYISLGSYLANTDTLKALEFKAFGETEYVQATVENIKNGSYKLQRPFVIVTRKDGSMKTEEAKEFYEWLWSEEAQKIISEHGYVVEAA